MEAKSDKPFPLPRHLLWEYDYDSFNFDKGYRLVIERVVERGNIDDWRNILWYYGKEKILEVVNWSRQLDKRDKNLARIFVDSDFLKKDAA